MSSAALRFYEFQFAPCAETWRDAIRVGQRVWDDGPVYESFAPTAFRDAGVKSADVKILVDHDIHKVAGTCVALAAHRDWHVGTFVLDGPYAAEAVECIERHGGKLSPGFNPIDKDPISAKPISPNHAATHWYTRAKLNEISVLMPGSIPGYVGARVTRVSEPKPSAPPKPKPATAKAVRELRRRHEGHDLLIDMSDGTQVIHSGVVTPAQSKAPAHIVHRAAARRLTPAEEDAELRRRLELSGYENFEIVLENLKAELGYGGSIDRWLGRTRAR